MNNRIVKTCVTLILIMIIIFMQIPVVRGEFDYDPNDPAVEDAAVKQQGESGPVTPPPTPDDAPGIIPPSNPEPVDRTPTETIYYYEKISGNVYEDLGYTNTPNVTAGMQNPPDDGKGTIPVQGVKVLLKQGDTIVATTYTDAEGNYTFTPPDGTYSVEFWYGDVEGMNLQQTQLVKTILKYNGHDYITLSTPGQRTYQSMEALEIQLSGKGAAQVFIALDCSYGMRTTQVNVNGEIKTRLQIATESAKQLINSLINSGENIYIGLIFFSGTNYRAVSLTKDISILSKALDQIVNNGWQTPNTNILGALDKAKNSFYNNDKNNSNRFLAIISDGLPSSDGATQTYYDEPISETLSKMFNIIGPNTKKKVNELKDDGINIISLFAKSDNKIEVQYAEDIFKDASSIYAAIQDGQETIDMITKSVKQYLINSTDEKEYSSSFTVLAGCEDKERRDEVDKNFEIFNYGNTIMFDQIENYNATSSSQEQAKKLSDLTKMKVLGGQNYVISHKPADKPDMEEIKDSETGEVIKRIYYVSTEFGGQNMTLGARPALSLVTQTTSTGLEIILADGSMFDLQTQNVGSDLPMIKAIDDELTHGATIRVEYTIKIKNDSSIQCNYLELIDHLPPGFTFNKNLKLITEDKKNSDYGFEEVSLQNLYDTGYISEGTLNYARSRKSIKVILDNNKGFYISPGGEYTVKFVTSRVISKLDDIEEMQNTIAEVLVYKDNSNRRMAYKESITMGDSNIQLLRGVYPGDSKDKDCSSYTNKVYIMPPTGANRNILIRLITIMMAVILLVIITMIIKPKKLTNKVRTKK